MPRFAPLAVLVTLAFAVVMAPTVAGHDPGEEEIVVEPATVTAGEVVVLAGTGLEPATDRVLVLAGEDLVVEFGTVMTDAEGMFQAELTIPSHLPAGMYELRAIGDETLTVPLAITAAAGGTEPSPPNAEGETVVPRERTPMELAVILALVVLAALTGGLLVWRAERRPDAAGA